MRISFSPHPHASATALYSPHHAVRCWTTPVLLAMRLPPPAASLLVILLTSGGDNEDEKATCACVWFNSRLSFTIILQKKCIFVCSRERMMDNSTTITSTGALQQRNRTAHSPRADTEVQFFCVCCCSRGWCMHFFGMLRIPRLVLRRVTIAKACMRWPMWPMCDAFSIQADKLC